MIRFINRKKARKEIKKVWCAHQRLNLDCYENETDLIEDAKLFAEGIFSLVIMLGIMDLRSPCDWED